VANRAGAVKKLHVPYKGRSTWYSCAVQEHCMTSRQQPSIPSFYQNPDNSVPVFMPKSDKKG
jgi:hypothetical protein